MTLIDLNEIYKIIYYKYILLFKVLDIIGVKHSQSLKTKDPKNQGFRGFFKICSYAQILEISEN